MRSKLHVAIYTELADRARKQIADTGQYIKADVAKRIQPPALAQAISDGLWKDVRTDVSEEIGEPLLPIANQPLTPEGTPYDPDIHPEKFPPSAGRKHIGFSTIPAMHSGVAIASIQRRLAQLHGLAKSFDNIAIAAQKHGLLTYKRQTLPQITTKAKAEHHAE